MNLSGSRVKIEFYKFVRKSSRKTQYVIFISLDEFMP